MTIDLTKYNKIHVHWIDFREMYWRAHGYNNIDDWKNDIAYLNESFQMNLGQYWLAGKEVIFSENKDSKNYPPEGLLVTFDDVYIDYNNYYLHLSMKFTDLSNNETLLKLEQEAYYGNNYGFTGYLTYALDNVAQRIAWVIMQKKKRNLLR
ncbi:MAG: hypothetical protein ACTSVS_07645 [Candidatus Heimdallarchaeota archaeon]